MSSAALCNLLARSNPVSFPQIVCASRAFSTDLFTSTVDADLISHNSVPTIYNNNKKEMRKMKINS